MNKSILIVEDERIIAEDIKSSLVNFNYEVVDIVSDGQSAIESAYLLKPDLILMDIKIEGEIDGIETAKIITSQLNVPIVYLTANADKATLNRAKATNPYGYIVKPFEDIDLNATLQVAFTKFDADSALAKSEMRFKKIIEENTDGIALINDKLEIIYINKAFEKLFGKSQKELLKTKFGHTVDTSSIFEISIPGKNDSVKMAEVHIVQIEWDGKPAYLATLRDITLRKQTQLEVLKSNQKLRKLMTDLVDGLISAIEMRDPYTAGHQKRVAELACAIGREMNLSEDQIDGLRIASLVHDIGKIQIPSEILSKPGQLTEIEMAIIKTHSQAGYEILKSIDFPWPIAKAVLQHHEKLDGSGYPMQISSSEIILEARIIGVADVVEAMSSHRPYRPSRGMDIALEEIIQNNGTFYDPQVVDACINVIINNKFSFSENS
ncbi:MAG TPA: response regulator [Candidatus Cloacimonadota bacterium]|nr:response regulator [Candidatus Cloacimonadota bacterium]